MELRANAASLTTEWDIVVIGFELVDVDLAYLLIMLAAGEGQGLGDSHYVELKDQAHGRHEGLDRLTVDSDDRVSLQLNFDVPGLPRALSIRTATPLAPDILAHLRQLEAHLGARDG